MTIIDISSLDNKEIKSLLKDETNIENIFIQACKFGFSKIVKLCIRKGVNVNVVKDGKCGIHHAAVAIGSKCLALLLESADINAVDDKGKTALHHACECDNFDKVKMLAERCKLVQDKDGLTALAYVKSEICFEVLLKAGLLNRKENVGLLHHACKHKNEYFIKRILDGADYGEEMKRYNKSGETALHVLCERPWVKHAKIDEISTKTARRVCRLYVGETFDGYTPLHIAAKVDSTNLCVLAKYVDGINERDATGNTPLHYAVASEDISSVRILLDRGADMSLRNNDGKTAENIACDAIKSFIDLHRRKQLRTENCEKIFLGGLFAVLVCYMLFAAYALGSNHAFLLQSQCIASGNVTNMQYENATNVHHCDCNKNVTSKNATKVRCEGAGSTSEDIHINAGDWYRIEPLQKAYLGGHSTEVLNILGDINRKISNRETMLSQACKRCDFEGVVRYLQTGSLEYRDHISNEPHMWQGWKHYCKNADAIIRAITDHIIIKLMNMSIIL